MTESTRPKRVVIVDADNPMEEIHGEFFWREDHERALAEAREEAFRQGVWQGWKQATRQRQEVVVRFRRRSPIWLLTKALRIMAVVSVALLVLVYLTR